MSWRLPRPWPEEEVPQELARFGLGPRLARIASLVPAGRSAVDVGTDHALLPIALVGSGRSPRAIGIDRNREPLARAEANRARFSAEVELRLGDGLAIAPDEAEVAILAGIGGRSVGRILEAGGPLALGIERIVAQPNSDFEDVRRIMAALGYRMAEERFVAEGDRFFLVMAWDRAEPQELSAVEAFLGGIRADPLFAAWAELQRIHWSKKPSSPEAVERLRLLEAASSGRPVA